MFNTSQFNQIELNQSFISRIIGYLKMKLLNKQGFKMKILNHR